MKGFTRDNKFIPMTDYKKVTRKSRDQKEKTTGVRFRKLTKAQIKRFEEQTKQRKIIIDAHDKKFPPYHIGDVVKTPLGVGEITFIRHNIDEEPPYDEPKYKVRFTEDNAKFVDHSSIEKIRKARDTDSGEIPPEKIFDKNRLTKHDGRYFLVAEGFPDTLAVDEYEKVNENLFKLKRNILFSQSGEETQELLRVTGGGGRLKHVGGFGLKNEKKFLEGLESSGALQESNFGSWKVLQRITNFIL